MLHGPCQILGPWPLYIPMGDLLDHRSWLFTELVRLGVPLERARKVVAGLSEQVSPERIDEIEHAMSAGHHPSAVPESTDTV